jgi:hypothetical protein
MGECLIADVSLFDVHFQAWMLVVLGIPLVLIHRRLGNEKCSPRFLPSKYEPHGSQHTAISGVSV